MLGPDAGVAVGLQLEAHRVAVAALLGAHLAHRAEQVLHVVAVLVGEHVGLRELPARGAELALEHVLEERRVEVDVLVDRAVERPDVGGGVAAAGVDAAGEDRRPRRRVVDAGLRAAGRRPRRTGSSSRPRPGRSRGPGWRPRRSGTGRARCSRCPGAGPVPPPEPPEPPELAVQQEDDHEHDHAADAAADLEAAPAAAHREAAPATAAAAPVLDLAGVQPALGLKRIGPTFRRCVDRSHPASTTGASTNYPGTVEWMRDVHRGLSPDQLHVRPPAPSTSRSPLP